MATWPAKSPSTAAWHSRIADVNTGEPRTAPEQREMSYHPQAGSAFNPDGLKAWVAGAGRLALWATWRAGAPTRKSGGTGDAPPPPATGSSKAHSFKNQRLAQERHAASRISDWLKQDTPSQKPMTGSRKTHRHRKTRPKQSAPIIHVVLDPLPIRDQLIDRWFIVQGPRNRQLRGLVIGPVHIRLVQIRILRTTRIDPDQTDDA